MTTLDKLRQLRREHMLYCYAATPLPPNRECSCGASAHNALLDECVAEVAAILEAADDVWIANGCGSSELWDRAIFKLRALTSPLPTPPTKEAE